MAARQAKRLFDVLDEAVFQPVLQSADGNLSQQQRFNLQRVKDSLAGQREQFLNCASDEEVYEAYHEQLGSNEENRLTRQLRDLDLPALQDCRDQVETAAGTLFDKSVRKQSRLP